MKPPDYNFKSLFKVGLSMSVKITGQMSADGALQVSKMLAIAVQILAGGLALAAVIWAISCWW